MQALRRTIFPCGRNHRSTRWMTTTTDDSNSNLINEEKEDVTVVVHEEAEAEAEEAPVVRSVFPTPPSDVMAKYSLADFQATDGGFFFPISTAEQHQYLPEGLTRRIRQMFEDMTFQASSEDESSKSSTSNTNDPHYWMLRHETCAILQELQNWDQCEEKPTAMVLDGPMGCGKSIALAQIVQFCRAQNWIVMYLPNPRSWCTEAPYVEPSKFQEQKFDIDVYGEILLNQFMTAHGEQLKSLPIQCTDVASKYSNASISTLFEMAELGQNDAELSCEILVDLRHELGKVTSMPVLIAVDDVNTLYRDTVFGWGEKDLEVTDISVLDALRDIPSSGDIPADRVLTNGLYIAATTETYPSKYKFKSQVNYRAFRKTYRGLAQDELSNYVQYLRQQNFIFDDMTAQDMTYMQLMTLGNPHRVFQRAKTM